MALAMWAKYIGPIVFPFSFTAVNAADGDIIVESADLTLFKLHRKNLQCYAGAFPLPGTTESSASHGSSSALAKITLPEPASVLEVLFDFLYLKVKEYFPCLSNMEFEDFMAIADAVEKYQVFSAKHLCIIRLQ